MASDPGLLELAAKAAGFPYSMRDARGWFRVRAHPSCEWELWDPLTDDGECARLEATLQIELHWDPVMVLAGPAVGGPTTGTAYAEYFDAHGGDKNAARRAASTKAAAQLGKGGSA